MFLNNKKCEKEKNKQYGQKKQVGVRNVYFILLYYTKSVVASYIHTVLYTIYALAWFKSA